MEGNLLKILFPLSSVTNMTNFTICSVMTIYLTNISFARENNNHVFLSNVLAISIVIHMLILLSGSVHPNPGPTLEYNSNTMSICHLNIRSLHNSVDKMDHISSELTPTFDIIAVTETWLKSTSKASILSLPG